MLRFKGSCGRKTSLDILDVVSCYRLHLGIKDALKTTSFSLVDVNAASPLQKSPKKCHQLDEIIAHLKECV